MRAVELEILPYCREKGIGVLGYMALMQGVLADIYPTLADVPAPQRRTRHFDSRRTPQCCHGLPARRRKPTRPCKPSVLSPCNTDEHAGDRPEVGLRGQGITSSLCGSRNVKGCR